MKISDPNQTKKDKLKEAGARLPGRKSAQTRYEEPEGQIIDIQESVGNRAIGKILNQTSKNVTEPEASQKLSQPRTKNSGNNLELSELLPNAAFSFKYRIDYKLKFLLGPFYIWPKGEISGKLKIGTKFPLAFESSITEKGIEAALKLKFNEMVQLDGKSLKLSFDNILLKPEIAFNFIEISKPVSLSISAEILSTKINLFEGVNFNGEGFKVTVELGIGPSPAFSSILGINFAAGAGAVGMTALIIAATAGLVGDAREEGKKWGSTIARRSSYAWRIAGEISGESGLRTALETLDFQQSAGDFASALNGWQSAQNSLAEMSEENRKMFVEAMRKHFGLNVKNIHHVIFQKLGGFQKNDTGLPSNPIDLMSI